MKSDFDWVILNAINNAIRTVKASPLVLGATPSGLGGPIGGYIGYLLQSRVSFDTVEASDWEIPESGISLVTNLNRIRHRLDVIESGTYASGVFSGGFLDLDDTPATYSGHAGQAVIVNPSETGLTFATISGGSSTGGAFQRKLTSNLTLADGECLVVAGYIQASGYSIELLGDSRLAIL